MKNTVEKMQIEHLADVLSLSSELGYPGILEELQTRFEILNALKNHALFISSSSRGTNGFIHLEAVDDLIEERKVEIKALIVSEKERNSGIGHELIKSAIEWAKMYGVHTIYLNCNTLRNRAHSFYEREGFKKVKTSHFFEMKI
ncbi:MAG: GNAT family N-acetyltransferase [Bdellovibrionales bacterium]|nr:GNAT family N-acetyltransferase [Bdellovibrionales bacterium]